MKEPDLLERSALRATRRRTFEVTRRTWPRLPAGDDDFVPTQHAHHLTRNLPAPGLGRRVSRSDKPGLSASTTGRLRNRGGVSAIPTRWNSSDVPRPMPS